jgi:hypothetical protein
MNTQLNDGAVVYYAISLNGRIVSSKFTDRTAAEHARQSLALTPQQRQLAEVVVVDGSNNQLLLG